MSDRRILADRAANIWSSFQRNIEPLARGATISATLTGYGATCDAHHITKPEPSGRGALSAMRMALSDAKLDASAIDYVNAHASSTPLNDSTESQAIRRVLGPRAFEIPVERID